jgi:hypothetical protein
MQSKYVQYRQVSKALNNRIVKTIKRHELHLAAKSLNLLVGDVFVFDSEEETSTMMDRIIYDFRRGGTNVLGDFIAGSPPEDFSEMERQILEGMSKAWFSLFQAEAVAPQQNSIDLKDIINLSGPFKLIDLGLSHSARAGDLLAIRLIPLEDWHMTSGVGYPFEPHRAAELLAGLKQRIAGAKKRKFKIVSPEDYSRYFFHKFKQLRESEILFQEI